MNDREQVWLWRGFLYGLIIALGVFIHCVTIL